MNEDVLNGTVLLILVTCVVSSFITERAARKIAMCEAHLEERSVRLRRKGFLFRWRIRIRLNI